MEFATAFASRPTPGINVTKMHEIRTWLIQWLYEVSELTLRILLLRCFGIYVFNAPIPRIFVVQSPNEQLHIEKGGVLQIPASCGSSQALEELLRNELFLMRLKSDVERRNRMTQQDWNMVAQAVRSEIRAGGWYQCPNGHPYTVVDQWKKWRLVMSATPKSEERIIV